MIFVHLTENLRVKKEKYLMYARFVQMLINEQAPELEKTDADVIPLEKMTDYTVGSMTVYKSTTRPRDRRLVGHLSNPGYVAPPGKKWRNEGSDSEQENMEIPEDSDSEKEDLEEGPHERSVTKERPDFESVEVADDDEAEAPENFELRKRSREEVSVGEATSSKKTPKRAKFVLKPLTRRESPVVSQPQPQQTPPPQPTSTPAAALVPSSSTSASASLSVHPDIAKKINTMNSLLVKLMSENLHHIELNKKMLADNKIRDAHLKELTDRYNGQQVKIQQLETQNKEQTDRIKELEEGYEALQKSMYADDEGFLKLKDNEEEEEIPRLGGDTGASGSGAGTDN